MTRAIGGLVLLAMLMFLVSTQTGQDLLIQGVGLVSNEATNWLIDQLNETQERAEARGPRSERKCGDELPPVEANVPEEQAIEAALKFWGKKKVQCDDIETELLTSGKPQWLVTLPEKRGCSLTATIDAVSGKAIKGGGGCP